MDKRFKLLTPADKASEGKELVITGKGAAGRDHEELFQEGAGGAGGRPGGEAMLLHSAIP